MSQAVFGQIWLAAVSIPMSRWQWSARVGDDMVIGAADTEPAAQLAAEQASRQILEGMLARLKEACDGG